MSIERPVWMERQWVAIDTLGTVRNTLGTTGVFLGDASSKAARVIGQAIPGFQALGGSILCYNALKHNLPNVWKEYQSLHPDDREGKIVTGLSLANQGLYLAIGEALLLAGATGLVGNAASGAVGSALLQTSQVVANSVLGGLCVVRGAVMTARCGINLAYLIPFHANYRHALQEGAAVAFLQKEMGGAALDFDAFKRRVGDGAAEKVAAYFRGERSTPLQELLLTVDKGIYKQKCKQWLTLSIAVLMIIGGVASLIFTAGLTAIAVAGVMGISYALTEADWLLFDKSSWFNALVDALYKPPSFPVQIA